MTIRIEDNAMTLEVDGGGVATARCGLSTQPFSSNEAITAMMPAERLAAG